MEFEQLKNQWRKEMDTIQRSDNAMFTGLQVRVSRLNSLSIYEDVRDVLLWLMVAFFFSFHWLIATNVVWLERLGLTIILSNCFFIIYKTLRVRSQGRTDDWTLSEKIANEVSRIEKKSRLLMLTATWYLVPLYVGLCLVPIGRLLDKTSAYAFDSRHIYYYLFCMVMAIIGYWWSRRVVQKQYAPVLADLEKLHGELKI